MIRDVRGSVALFLYRKVAAAPACEPVFMAGPPMDMSEAAMTVRALASSVASPQPQPYLLCGSMGHMAVALPPSSLPCTYMDNPPGPRAFL